MMPIIGSLFALAGCGIMFLMLEISDLKRRLDKLEGQAFERR